VLILGKFGVSSGVSRLWNLVLFGAVPFRPKEGLPSLARKNLLLDLNWFPQTGMRRVVVAAPLTEGLSATPHAAI